MNRDENRWADLVAGAKKASVSAYCPYSRFAVGAAVLTSDGKIFAAPNVENASYGLSICAERNAIFHAVAAGSHDIAAIAIYTPTPIVSTPCGACRQVLIEFGRNAEVLCVCDGAEQKLFTAASLLPSAFELHESQPPI